MSFLDFIFDCRLIYLFFYFKGLVTQPFSSLVATFIQIRTTLSIAILFVLSIVFSGYIIASSLLNPCPPFVNESYGGHIMVKHFRYKSYNLTDLKKNLIKGCSVDYVICFVNVFEMCYNNSAKEKAYREIACVVRIVNAIRSIHWRYIKLLFG